MSSTCLAEFRRRKNWVNYIQYNYSTITRFAQPELFWTIRAFFRKPFTISVVVNKTWSHPTVWSTNTSMETGSVGRGANRPGVVPRGVFFGWNDDSNLGQSFNLGMFPYSIWVTRTLFHWLVNAYQRRCPLRIGWCRWCQKSIVFFAANHFSPEVAMAGSRFQAENGTWPYKK